MLHVYLLRPARRPLTRILSLICLMVATCPLTLVAASPASVRHTRVGIVDGRWQVNGQPTHPGTPAAGTLLNVRMVNSVFEDRSRTDFDADRNTNAFVERLPVYVEMGVRAFTIGLQGGGPGYETAVNSAFDTDGSLRADYLARVQRVIDACDRVGAIVILSCFYQRQDQQLRDAAAVRAGVRSIATWLREQQFTNVLLEITNESGHTGFDHDLLKSADGQAELLSLARQVHPGLLVSTSGLGDGTLPDAVAKASDFLLVHFNDTPVEQFETRVRDLQRYGKPIVCNEDMKTGPAGARAAKRCVELGASWGYLNELVNQRFPFQYEGDADDPDVYRAFADLTTPVADSTYFPPPESAGGWRRLTTDDELRGRAQMDPARLSELRDWLLASDDRNFAAVVVRHGYVVLEVERGRSSATDTSRIASVSKAICATVLAIAAEESQAGHLPRRMSLADPAFDYLPWAQPLSDARKRQITVKQLLNHTSGLCPEATGAPNDGAWQYVLGHTGDDRTARLAFDPGTACGYSTHALCHAALVCETVTGQPYDQYAIAALLRPLGCEHWWFQSYVGDDAHGRHPSHGMGLPARDLARIGYCFLQQGRWQGRQVIPRWFVAETAAPTHHVTTPELRWQLNPRVFTHGWELPAYHWGRTDGERNGTGIPLDTRSKPGSGGQILAFIPSLDLVVARQTGSSGDWPYEEVVRRAAACVLN